MVIDATHKDVEWCRRCGNHQAMRDLDGICPVCDPDGTQALVVATKTKAALDRVDQQGKARAALVYSPAPVEPDQHIVRSAN